MFLRPHLKQTLTTWNKRAIKNNQNLCTKMSRLNPYQAYVNTNHTFIR